MNILSTLKTGRFKFLLFKLLLCCFVFTTSSSMASGKVPNGSALDLISANDVVLVANKANTINSLKQSQLVRIYLRKTKRFENGMDVVPIDLNVGDTRNTFYRKMIGKSERQLKYYWSRMMFSGNTRPPKKLRSDRAVISYVADNVNAVGYVRADSVTDDIKIIGVLDD